MSEPNDTREEVELPPRPKRYSAETGVLANQVPGRCNTWSKTTEDADGNEIDAQEFDIYADEVERQLEAALAANREKDAEIALMKRTMKHWEDSYLAEHGSWGDCKYRIKLESIRAAVGGEKWIDVKQELPPT